MSLIEELERYEAPEWARDLPVQPQYRTKFSMKPTPIHKWDLPGVPPEFKVSIKREDLTGSIFSGNKIALLWLQQGYGVHSTQVVDAKGARHPPSSQEKSGSNHARATALAARHLGLDCHLFLITKDQYISKGIPVKGNHLLHRLSRAKIHVLPPKAWNLELEEKTRLLENFAEKLRSEGHHPYVVPIGGSSAIGTWGYIDAWQEMMEQGLLTDFDDIVLAAGTTGSLCGLAIGNCLTGSKIRLHGVTVAMTPDRCYAAVQDHLDWFGIQKQSRDLVNIIEGYIGIGYGQSTAEELQLIIDVMSKTGQSLDPDYTAKAVKGMLMEMNERPHIFKGHRILFIHTGGIFGLYDGRIEEFAATATAHNVTEVSNLEDLLP